MGEQDFVNVLAFGGAADVVGWTSKQVSIGGGETVAGLMGALEKEHPGLGEVRERIRYAVNRQYAAADAALKAGDEVAFLPATAGGAAGAVSAARAPTARLVRKRIDVAGLMREVENTSVGAVAALAGAVWYQTNEAGQALKAVEYEAYEPMALAEMHRLCAEATSRFGVHKAVLVQRVGRVKVGEVSMAAVVSAAEREAASEACRMLVDGLTESVPVFCKRLWQGGGTSWANEL